MSSNDLTQKYMCIDGPRRGEQITTSAQRIKLECRTHKVRFAIYDVNHIGNYYFLHFMGWEDDPSWQRVTDEDAERYLRSGKEFIDTTARVIPKKLQ